MTRGERPVSSHVLSLAVKKLYLVLDRVRERGLSVLPGCAFGVSVPKKRAWAANNAKSVLTWIKEIEARQRSKRENGKKKFKKRQQLWPKGSVWTRRGF